MLHPLYPLIAFQHATSSAVRAGSETSVHGPSGCGPILAVGAESVLSTMSSSPAMPTPALTPEVETYW